MMSTTKGDELLTPDEVARELKISRESARRLLTNGTLAYVAVGTGSVRKIRRVRRADLEEFKQRTFRENAAREFASAKAMVSAAENASAGSYY